MEMMSPLNRLPHDKALHAIGGLIIWAVAFSFGFSIWQSEQIVFGAAVAKEAYDKSHPKKHTADFWDMIATISLAMFVGAIVHYRMTHG